MSQPLPSSRRRYVARLLDLYRSTPGTRGVIRAADRRLAADLYRRQVPLELVHLALRLAVARRQQTGGVAPLARINSLHYFLPLLDELSDPAVDPGYLDYLRHRLLPPLDPITPSTDHQRA